LDLLSLKRIEKRATQRDLSIEIEIEIEIGIGI
jgi:hypothetical protein